MLNFEIIVAMDQNGGIGKGGKLPWDLKGDLKRFKEITTQTNDPTKKNIVIMGRKTWESLPEKVRPLPGRINVVLSRNAVYALEGDVVKVESLVCAFEYLERDIGVDVFEKIFIIGGEQLFRELIILSECKKIYTTQIEGDFCCDAYFPPFEEKFKEVKSTLFFKENNIKYRFVDYIPAENNISQI